MFWICSRIFSISVFISTTSLVISKLLAFEPIVFVSLFISWTIKSSFFPTGPSCSSKFVNCAKWLFSLVISSSIEHLSEYITTSCSSLFLSTVLLFNNSFILASNFTIYSWTSPVEIFEISSIFFVFFLILLF